MIASKWVNLALSSYIIATNSSKNDNYIPFAKTHTTKHNDIQEFCYNILEYVPLLKRTNKNLRCVAICCGI